MYNVRIFHVTSVPIAGSSTIDWDKWNKAYVWCRDTLGNSHATCWYNNPQEGYFCFTKKEDATAFKLKFGV